MESRPITNTENIINSRELLTRIKWLEQQLNYRCSDAYSEELKALDAFSNNIEAVASVSTYEPGTNLVRDSYLEEYSQAAEASNPGNTTGAAFSPVDFNDVVYWLPQGS